MEHRDEYQIKFFGNFELPMPLKDEHEYTVGTRVCINGFNSIPNHDGSHTIVYKGKVFAPVTIINADGSKIHGKPKKGRSKQTRLRLMNIYNGSIKWQEKFKEFETFYDFAYNQIENNIEDILNI